MLPPRGRLTVSRTAHNRKLRKTWKSSVDPGQGPQSLRAQSEARTLWFYTENASRRTATGITGPLGNLGRFGFGLQKKGRLSGSLVSWSFLPEFHNVATVRE
jgi:hypothetical protein